MALRTDPETLVTVLIMPGSAALIAFLGHRVRGGETWLIAGYHPDSVEDEEGVARLVGNTTIVLGVVTVIYALATLFVEPLLWYWLSYLAIFGAALVYVQLRGRQYAA